MIGAREIIHVLALFGLLVDLSVGADVGSLRAGAAAVDISPTQFPRIIAGSFLEGRADRSTDPLFVRSIVLADGVNKIALTIVDTCMMTQELIDKAKYLASLQSGIPVDHMMVSATHTHSAPAAMACLGTRQDEDYAAWLPGKISEAIVAANSRLQLARIGRASIDDWEHTHNRRWIRKPEKKVVDPFGQATGLAHMHPGHLSPDVIGPSGPVDPALSIVSVQTREGSPLALLANYSQHYFGSEAVSADYYGIFCKQIASILRQPGDGNGPFVVAMSQGTSGDLMWMDYGVAAKTITMESYAHAVAAYAEKALSKIQYQDSVPLGMVERKLVLKYRVPDAKRLEWATAIVGKMESELPKSLPEVYAMEARILHDRQETELKLQAIRIGDLTIATLPNEVYALTGLKLRERSPSPVHFNIELANGAEGYIPPPEQHTLGGYTTWPARTAGLEVQAEPQIVETLLSALEEVTNSPRRTMTDHHGLYAQAILEAIPVGYWRLNDADGATARNAQPGGQPAALNGGYAYFLPGVGSGSGTGSEEALTQSRFSNNGQVNRSFHFAGGRMTTQAAGLDQHYSIVLWFWLGQQSGASQRSGTLVAGPSGERLVAHQLLNHLVHLELSQGELSAQSETFLRADDWNFAVLVRDGASLYVHVNGQSDPSLRLDDRPSSLATALTWAEGLQGKLDEVAVFKRSISQAEISKFWLSSGMSQQPK